TMNPEEGRLRPQLLDRFGLRAVARGLMDPKLRYRAYEHVRWYRRDSEGMAAAYAEQTLALAEEIESARGRLDSVTVNEQAKELGLRLITSMGIESSRAEITLFEAGRAHAAADGREVVTGDDVSAVAAVALRFRRSPRLDGFIEQQEEDDTRINALLAEEARAAA